MLHHLPLSRPPASSEALSDSAGRKAIQTPFEALLSASETLAATTESLSAAHAALWPFPLFDNGHYPLQGPTQTN